MENSKNNYSEEKPKNVVKYDLEKIYSKILGKDYTSYKFNKIVLGTKRLISNNLNYNDFSKEYDDITKIVSFKYPNLDNFPISKNLELIPLGKVRFSYDSTKKRIKSGILPDINDKSKNNNHNLFLKSSIKSNNKTINKIKINSVDVKESRKEKEENEFGSKSLSKIMGYVQIKNNNNGKTFSIDNNNSSIKYSSNYTSKKSHFFSFKNNLFNTNLRKRILIRNSFLNMLNYKKYLHNNRMLLRDSLLNEKDYFQLDYDEEKIFSQTEHYNNFIKNHLDLIKSNSLNFECSGKLEKTFEKTKINPKLVLKPITIQFTRIFCFNNKAHPNSKDEEEVQEQTFEIPFEYTPIFYLYNFSKIKEILASIFQFNKDYTSFTSNYKNFSYLLNHSSNYEDSSNFKQEEFQRNNSKKLLTSKTKNFQSLSLNKAYSGKIKRNSMSLQKEIIKTIDIFNNDSSLDSFNNKRELYQKYKGKSVVNNLNSKNNKIYFCNKNSFEFLWLTPVYEYLVNIKVPEISFYIGDITINKNIDIELLLFLLEHQFNNWDFYVIEYLFSFYKFSLIINNFLSIYKIGKYQFINNFLFNNNIINLSEEKKLKYSRKNYNFEYIFTDENLNNYIKLLHSYKILIFNKNINKEHQFCFHMNLIQMKSLYFSIKKQGAQHLIKKIFSLDNETMKIKINYDYLDNFGQSDFNNLENILHKNGHDEFLETKENKYNFNINENKICLVYPNLESIKFINNISPNKKEDCFESNSIGEVKERLNFSILEKILKTKDLFLWPNVIEFFKDNKGGFRKSKNILENPLSPNKKYNMMKSVIIKKRNFFKIKDEELI